MIRFFNGQEADFSVTDETLIEELRDRAATFFGLRAAKPVLFRADALLDPTMTLAQYGIPRDGVLGLTWAVSEAGANSVNG